MMATGKMNRRGNAMIITLLLLVILTAIGIYAVSITTTEMDIALHTRVGTITRNIAESGAYFGIAQLPFTTYPPGSDCTVTLLMGPNITGTYTVSSFQTGALSIQPGYGANFRFADFGVYSSTSSGPSGFTGKARVDADINYGPIPSGTAY